MNYVPRNPQVPIYLQIKQFVQGLTSKRTQKVQVNEVQSLINQLGVSGEQYFLLQMLESLEISKEKQSQSLKGQFLVQWLQQATIKSHFIDYFSGVVEAINPQSPIEYLNELCNTLKLSPLIQMIMWLAMTFSSNTQYAKEGAKMLKKKLQEPFQTKNNLQIPSTIMHTLLYQIRNIPELCDLEQKMKNLNDYVANLKQADLKCLYDDTKKIMKLDPINIEIPKINECLKPVDILKELGPQVQNLQSLFTEFSDYDVMDCLLYVANQQNEETPKDIQQLFRHSQNGIDWDWNDQPKIDDDFIKFFHNDGKRIWTSVFDKLDRPNLELTLQGYNNIMLYMNRIKKLQPQFLFPHRLLLDKWNNKKSQIIFLTHLLKVCKPEQVFWSEIPNKKFVQMDHIQNFKPTQAMQYWCNLDFIQTLIELSEYGYIVEIREFFEQPIRQNPDLIILALFQITFQQGGALIDELFTLLFPNYVSQHANSAAILEQMWRHNQQLFITGISELYRKELGKKENSCLNLSRVLDIVQQLFQNSQSNNTSLLAMARCDDYQFSVPLGILAGKREYLNFDVWLKDRIKTQGVPFVNVLLQYVDENIVQQIKEFQSKQGLPSGQLGQMPIGQLDAILDKGQMKLEMVTIIFEQLMSESEKLGNRIKQLTQSYYKEVVQVFPHLAGSPNPKINAEVEEKTDNYFGKYYNEELSLDNFLQLMQQWKTNGSIQEKEVYACIITNLFNEYQYHPKYPRKELELTGQLFGGVLERGLVDGGSSRIGLQIILVSLKNQNQRYDFAVKALEVMKNKIYEQPQFALEVMNCEQLSLKNPDLLAEIIRICEKNGIKSPNQPQQPTPVVKPIPIVPQEEPKKEVVIVQSQHSQSVTPPPTHIKTTQLLPVQHTPQPQKVKTEDSINLSYKAMLTVDFDDLAKNIDQDTKEYFTFVLNNISQQNIEQKANELRPRLENPNIWHYFIDTIAYLRAPMQQSAGTPSTIFYLLLTLKKPNLFSEIAKEICIGLTRLLQINKQNTIPDDRNTLRNMGIFLGMITIYRNKPFLSKYLNYKQLLRLNIQTVYPLCKILEWAKQSQIFTKNNKWISRILTELNSVKENCGTMVKYEISNLLKQMDVVENEVMQQPQQQQIPIQQPMNNTPKPTLTPQPQTQDPDSQFSKLNIKNLPQYVTLDQKFATDKFVASEYRNLVATALDRAISDIIPPVISRSVTIALITTRELVFKDFALEPNEKYMLRGMHMIASHLSGSLAMVTCREPLKVRITHYLKEGTDLIDMDSAKKEQFVTQAAQENLDLGCALIKKAVIERALEDVNQDPLILNELEKRQKYREKGQIYRDEQAQLVLQFLPEQLQPRSTGLTEEEIRIYEEFGQKKKQPNKQTNIIQKVQQFCQQLQDPSSQDPRICQTVEELMSCEYYESIFKDLPDRFLELILLNNSTAEKIVIQLEIIQPLIGRVSEKENKKWSDFVIEFVQKSVDKLETSPLWWQAFPIMLKKRQMTVLELEKILTLIAQKETQIHLNGIVYILRQVIFNDENQNQSVTSFRNIIKEISKKKDSNNSSGNSINKFLQDLNTFVQANQQQQLIQPKLLQKKINTIKQFYSTIDDEFLSKVVIKMLQWYQESTPEGFKDFILQGTEQFFGVDNISKFTAYAIELSMNEPGKESQDHSQIEQFGKLIAFLGKSIPTLQLSDFFEKFFDGCLLVLTKTHESPKQKFNQRQLFKLFYNLLFDLQSLEQINITYFYIKFAEFLEKVEPNTFPGFAFAWLELLCNRYFIRIIDINEGIYAKLIIKLLEFVRESVYEESLQYLCVQEFFKGVLLFYILILNKYRQFGSRYALTFSDELPFTHYQLLNMTLSAYPNQTDDPQSCPTIHEIPDVQHFAKTIHPCLEDYNFIKFKEEILLMLNMNEDELKIRVNNFFKWDLKGKLPLQITGFFIVLPRIVEQSQRPIYNQLLTRIIKVSNGAQRNLIMNVILNQIRFPEKATEFYLQFITHQFISGDNFQVQEQLTILISRRLIGEGPKPWGMLFLHEELQRSSSPNNQYKIYQIQRNL